MVNLEKADKDENKNKLTDLERIVRNFENTKYYGYMFSVSYDGTCFDSFDENPGKKSVKSEFRKLMEMNGISIFKGIQQAGRTDSDVSAKENVLYINSRDSIEFGNLKHTELKGLSILKVIKTLPFLEFPDMVERRFYIYEYPENLISSGREEIEALCRELSGKRDFRKFTSRKGERLKNHVRDIHVKFAEGRLYFDGDGFLPQQVRIMSGFVLTGKLQALSGKYLTLDRIQLTEEMESLSFKKVEDIAIDKIEKIEKNRYFYIFYVLKRNKSEIIGKKGKNIKKLKNSYGNIVVKEI